MKALMIMFKILAVSSLLFIGSSVASYGQNVPVPFDRIKELAITQGQKNEDGAFLWEKTVRDIEYWMVYSPSDESVGCGQRATSGAYGWGIAYGLKGEFQFVEARMGQIVNLLILEEASALEIANQFFKEVEPLIKNLGTLPTDGKWVTI